MNFSFFTSLFKENKKTLSLPSSLLLKKLKDLNNTNNLIIYENITIYHHALSFFIPLLILDTKRGIFLFEYKEWSYDDLKNSTISKATNQDSGNETLAFENAHEFIKTKFNELTHSDGVPIYNFLLMENLNAGEYEHLDTSFKELLPVNRIMFSDIPKKEILKKLENVAPINKKLPDVTKIIGNLLIQRLIIDEDSMKLCTDEQVSFIEHELQNYSILKSVPASGKTSTILLKAILEKLKNPQLRIIIIQPTVLACDKLKHKLISTIEHAIIEIDITSIEIITPIELVNKHLEKLHKPQLTDTLNIENKLMKKKFHAADLIICDDTKLLDTSFIQYLEHIQKKNYLLLVQNADDGDIKSTLDFTLNFRAKENQIVFKQANQIAKTMQLLNKLLKSNSASDILVVSDNLTKEKLNEDLEFFIRDKAILLDSSKNLLYQELDNIILATYNQISSMEYKFVLLLDLETISIDKAIYASNLSTNTSYIIYDEEGGNIKKLKGNFENIKE